MKEFERTAREKIGAMWNISTKSAFVLLMRKTAKDHERNGWP